MDPDFTNIEYLKSGNKRQQRAYELLTKLSIFEQLRTYKPILTGTIPIEIDLPESDLDIICECTNHGKFAQILTSLFGDMRNFKIRTSKWNGLLSTIVTFQADEFEIEVFGQNVPTQNQNAYRHMIIEHRILKEKDAVFKSEIIRLKREGIKTEPAFAKLLGLQGDPYEELLKIEI